MGDKKPNKKKTPKAKEIKEVPVSGPPGSSSSSSFIRKSNKRVKAPTRHRLYKGEYVIPTYYIGSAAGYTNYMAGTINGKLILDQNGAPLRFSGFELEPLTK